MQVSKNEILYLGHVISATAQGPDAKKIITIEKFPTPNTLKNVRAFVALCSYYRKFIQDFARIVQQLTKLIRKEQAFAWDEDQIKAFTQLREKLTSAPVLAHYDHELETQLITYSSDV